MDLLTQQEYKDRFIAHLRKKSGMGQVDAEVYFEAGDDEYAAYLEEEGKVSPEESVDEGMTYWDAD